MNRGDFRDFSIALTDEEMTVRLHFVCTGNICRSPTAERLALAFAAQERLPGFSATSAGLRAVIGHPMHRDAAAVLESLGGDAAEFFARQFSAREASTADLVLTMTRSQRDAVLERAPHLLSKTFTLAEACGLAQTGADVVSDLAARRAQVSTREQPDVPDPIGRDAAVFEAVGIQIANLLPPVMRFCARASSRVSDATN